MTQSDAYRSLRSNSLIIRENTELSRFRSFWSLFEAGKSLIFSGVLAEIPYSMEQGTFRRYQGVLLLDQGIFFD
jgi:hypothetical protein